MTDQRQAACWFCGREVGIDNLIAGYDTWDEQRLACLDCDRAIRALYEKGWLPADERRPVLATQPETPQADDLRAALGGWHLTDRNIDAMNAALTGTFAIYDDPEAGTDVDGDAVTMLDKLREYGYLVVSSDAIRTALRDAAYNPSLDEALNSGDGSYRP